MRKSEEEALSKCNNVLRKMREAINKQRNISKDVQNGVTELEELLDVIADYRRNWKSAEKERGASKLRNVELEVDLLTPKSNTYKNKRSASSPGETNPQKKHKKPTETAVEVESDRHSTEKEPEWKTVNRNRKPNIKRPKVRPEAVVIKPRDGHSYADVLRRLREKVNPENTDVAVQSVRKTKTGSLLLIMGKGGNKEEFRETIKGSLKEEAIVNSVKTKATIEIQDLDVLTTEDEVIDSIIKTVNAAKEEVNIRLTAANIREQKRAFVSLPAADANKLLEKRRILVGWTYCKIKYKVEVKRCYRCFESGHMQWECKGPDRKGMGICIKCGQKGHKLKECVNTANCCICSQYNKNQASHMPGSYSCNPNQYRTQ
ncbi:uncharacterized protein LOC131804555 [Musca domestica]|uniref:Uncharacterized protein LOC131804555 n=1 Tax=Musca domestica TaxID=7370 RepID=A0ABM3VCP6_MUSDO|nr:uncharacterized protein LOC131804555 [Musca domestica]